MEVWKDIKGYEGLYKVSNTGKVKSLEKRHGRGKGYIVPERLLRLITKKNGYVVVSLLKKSKAKQKFVHILVAESFLNHKSGNRKVVIDHKDNNPANNNLNNIRVVTQRDNVNFGYTRKTNSSKYIGVSKRKNRYCARIYYNGKYHQLGSFKKEYDAHLAYERAKQIFLLYS